MPSNVLTCIQNYQHLYLCSLWLWFNMNKAVLKTMCGGVFSVFPNKRLSRESRRWVFTHRVCCPCVTICLGLGFHFLVSSVFLCPRNILSLSLYFSFYSSLYQGQTLLSCVVLFLILSYCVLSLARVMQLSELDFKGEAAVVLFETVPYDRLCVSGYSH